MTMPAAARPCLVSLALAASLAGCDAKKADATADPTSASVAPEGPPAAAAPKPGPRFEERAVESGVSFRMRFLPDEQGENFKINLYDHGCGVSVADVDGDGRDDLFFCNQLGPCGLYRNDGTGKFADVTKESGDVAAALDGKICVAAAFGDVDGDGDEDLYVTTTRGGNAFFENTGGGKFRDATKDAGLTLVAHSEAPCFFDMDADGDLDLLVTNTARWTLDEFDVNERHYAGKAQLADLVASPKEWNVLYRNDGKGRFADVTDEAGMKGRGWGGDVAVFDCDADGDLDVFVGNMFGASALYANDGKGRFADVTRRALGRTSWGAVGAKAMDYDGDGRLDLFVVDMHSDMWTPANLGREAVEEDRKYPSFLARAIQLGGMTRADEEKFEREADIRRDEVVFGTTLYRALGGGAFQEVSDGAGVETLWPWGIADADFDGDGFVDAFLPSGMGSPFFYWRSPLLRNRGDGTFVDMCREAGLEPPPGGIENDQWIGGRRQARSCRSAATGDFDGDGRVDLVVNNYNDRAFLWRNVSPERHWCELRLVGTRSNRDAIGAVVSLTAGGRTQVRQVQAAGGYLAQSSNTLHFGLGDVGVVDKIEIRWPSGATQIVAKPKVDGRARITEPK
jgi:enediyne biosynthesis protein E4